MTDKTDVDTEYKLNIARAALTTVVVHISPDEPFWNDVVNALAIIGDLPKPGELTHENNTHRAN